MILPWDRSQSTGGHVRRGTTDQMHPRRQDLQAGSNSEVKWLPVAWLGIYRAELLGQVLCLANPID